MNLLKKLQKPEPVVSVSIKLSVNVHQELKAIATDTESTLNHVCATLITHALNEYHELSDTSKKE